MSDETTLRNRLRQLTEESDALRLQLRAIKKARIAAKEKTERDRKRDAERKYREKLNAYPAPSKRRSRNFVHG
jgi:hypothetical protein